MGPVKAIKLFYTRYFDVYGRSRRFEYAWILLLHILLSLLITVLIFASGNSASELDANRLNTAGAMLAGLYGLICLGSTIPWVTLNIRRFHDMNYTGWILVLFIGLWFIPPIGALGSVVQFFWMLFGSGTADANKYGLDPRFLQRDVFG